jgi:hypothetical protein
MTPVIVRSIRLAPVLSGIAFVACTTQPAPPAGEDAAVAGQVTSAGPASLDAAGTPPRAGASSAQAPAATSSSSRTAPAGTPAAPVDAASRPAPPATAPTPPQPTTVEVTIPAGTEVSVELLTNLSTETATTETAVRGRLRRAIVVGDRTAIPAGATLSGVVTEVERPGKVKGRGLLALRFTQVTVDSTRSPFPTRTITREGEADRKGDITKVGGGAGVGAVVGGILGGGSGAAKGAAIGGAAGTAATLLTRGKDVELNSGDVLSTSTSAAVTLELPR